jgi:hypothetical protein
MIDIRPHARREVARVLRIASAAIDKALQEPRKPVNYHGKLVNTHERHLAMKNRK